MSSTPILDREQPLPTVKKETWRPLLLGGAMAGIVLFLGPDAKWVRIFAAGFIPAFYLGVLVHELGHVAAGLEAQFELRALIVGAFFLQREKRGWKLRFVVRRFLSGGLTLMSPKSADGLVQRYIRMIAGGPAATLALIGSAAALAWIYPDAAAIRVVLIVNVMLGLSAFIPYTHRSQPSDAKVILMLRRKGPAAERLAALLYIIALDGREIEPRDWPREVVAKMDLPTDDKTYLTSAISVRYAVALAGGDSECIAEAIERALSASHEAAPDVQRAFYVAASCFQASFRNNVPLAQEWLNTARAVAFATSQEDWDSRALASIALAMGEHAQACEFLSRYLRVLDRHPGSGIIAAERARAVELLASSNEPKTAETSTGPVDNL